PSGRDDRGALGVQRRPARRRTPGRGAPRENDERQDQPQGKPQTLSRRPKGRGTGKRMTDEQIFSELREAVAEECDNPKVALTAATTAADVPGWDSLAHVRIIMNLEARLGVEIDISDTYRAATVGDLVGIVKAAA